MNKLRTVLNYLTNFLISNFVIMQPENIYKFQTQIATEPLVSCLSTLPSHIFPELVIRALLLPCYLLFISLFLFHSLFSVSFGLEKKLSIYLSIYECQSFTK